MESTNDSESLDDLIKRAIDKISHLLKRSHLTEAENITKQLLVVDPSNLQGLQLYGLILDRQKKYEEAIDVFKQAVALDESNSDNYNNIALCYLHSKDFSNALLYVEKAIDLNKDNENYLCNKGMILAANGQLSETIDFLSKFPESSECNRNLGIICGTIGINSKDESLKKSINYFKKAIELDPNNSAARINLAYSYQLNGNWDESWPEYEHRLEYWSSQGHSCGRLYDIFKPEKQWDGTALDGKTILIYCEQGAGDMIHFMRFLPQLKTFNPAKIIVATGTGLFPLFDGFNVVLTDVNDWFNNRISIEYDCHCTVVSFPFYFKLKPDQFLRDIPYIFAKGIVTKEHFVDYENLFKIGIVWAGSPLHPNDPKRSVHLSNFREIYSIPNVKLFSFQKVVSRRIYSKNEDEEIDLADGCEDMKLVDLSPYMTDFGMTVELLSEMDLIITVDTSVLHVAGAMGKRTWALIPSNPDWRWGLESKDNRWYSSVTLFRQDFPNDWISVFKKVKKELVSLISKEKGLA